MKAKGDKQEKPLQFKFLILGEAAIGKSSIIERYYNNLFSGNYLATIGVDVRKKRLEVNVVIALTSIKLLYTRPVVFQLNLFHKILYMIKGF